MKKFFLRHRLLSVLLLFAVVAVSYGTVLLTTGNNYALYVNINPACKPETVQVTFGENELTESPVLQLTDISVRDTYIRAVVHAKAKGTEYVSLKAELSRNGKHASTQVTQKNLRVGTGNLIYRNQQDYMYLALMAFSLLILIYYGLLFVHTLRHDRFSYNSIFFLSVVLLSALLLAVWGSASVYTFLNNHTLSAETMHTVNENLMTLAVFATLPPMFCFAVSVSVSNLALMRKEGARPANTLGIVVSGMMVLGLAVLFILYQLKMQYKYLAVPYAICTGLYVLFELVLVSTVFCGVYVSKSKPAFDKDYILILGCKIRKDGSLYPLVRGRADRAIEFYRAQLKKTGKAAVFVPSGGQGSDEVMAEGQAIANYLLSQGIPQEQILSETKSTTTLENMRFSTALIAEKNPDAKLVFSTTGYHVFRSGIIAADAGKKMDGIGSKTKWYFWPNAFLREVAGLFLSRPKKQLLILLAVAALAGLSGWLYTL